MTPPIKRQRLGKPLVSTDQELDALLQPPTPEELQRMIDKWVESAPPRARGYIFATVEEIIPDA